MPILNLIVAPAGSAIHDFLILARLRQARVYSQLASSGLSSLAFDCSLSMLNIESLLDPLHLVRPFLNPFYASM